LGGRTGFSDHSRSSYAAIMAVALGAKVFEKHLTLSSAGIGPDHAASLEPKEFAAYVSDIRLSELALGDGNKRPQASELNVRSVARRSIFAARVINQGDVYSESNLAVLRPGGNISAENYYDLLGKTASAESRPGEPLVT